MLEIEKAIFVGHDWGGMVIWAMPLLYPDRTLGLVGVNTPHLPRPPMAPTQLLTQMVGGDPDRDYAVWFQKPGVETYLERNPRQLFEKLMRRPTSPDDNMLGRGFFEDPPNRNPFTALDDFEPTGEPLLSPEDLEIYTSTFAEHGFRGPLNWYRNYDRNWERLPDHGVVHIDKPSLMITAQWDGVLPPAYAASMPERFSDLEISQIDECGHWTQQDKPEALNGILVDWLTRRFL